MTVSRQSGDKGDLHLFDAMFDHTGRQIKEPCIRSKELSDSISVTLRLVVEVTFTICGWHQHYKQRALRKDSPCVHQLEQKPHDYFVAGTTCLHWNTNDMCCIKRFLENVYRVELKRQRTNTSSTQPGCSLTKPHLQFHCGLKRAKKCCAWKEKNTFNFGDILCGCEHVETLLTRWQSRGTMHNCCERASGNFAGM